MPEKTLYQLDRVAIRMVKERPLISETPLDCPEMVVKLAHTLLKDFDREVFIVVNLQSNLKPINCNVISIGSLNATVVHPREVLKSVVLSNAAAVLLIHNHPSGKLHPSNEDEEVTARINNLLKMMEIQLLDHIILGPEGNYYSFSDHCEKSLN